MFSPVIVENLNCCVENEAFSVSRKTYFCFRQNRMKENCLQKRMSFFRLAMNKLYLVQF